MPPNKEGAGGRDDRSVTGKLFTLLSVFSPRRTVLTLSEIAHRSGLAVTTVHRLVGELVERGILERDSDRRYRIGLALFEIAALAPRGPGLREVALPYMEDLYEVTRENVQLGVRAEDEVVFVERIAGRASVGVRTRLGGRFPMPPTGLGLVLLAHAPSEVRQRVLEAPLRRFTPHTLTDPERVRSVLSDVRRDGFAISDRQVTSDALSVAAPVFGGSGEVVAALSVVLRFGSVRPSSLAPAVRMAARGISRALTAPVTSSETTRPD
ncbi:transcriptional regulator, IclR family [Actinopolyspora xinjiangensis]|uniref:Transcriptional regulator, IclR family n=1 Tax=Actinopolyspora xinjiangensis TaxID=405564 RepID=A0A1H0SJW0_9ACTN|nr:IclR family transcriptional regulator [Actinopolyspora xinjiangensis]SDP41809.1 transcriptional regulator, IclR family [Actinopolyspora xinjiangensis]